MSRGQIEIPAMAVRQGSRDLFSFAVDGKSLEDFTTISRVSRDSSNALDGYQRPEAVAHIAGIRRYLESPGAILPNALVVAFDKSVRFVQDGRRKKSSGVRIGKLVIPIVEAEDADKPGWIVDGQQRSAALREARIRNFPVLVTAFIAKTIDEQRSQFILVNATKPLPSGLIYELLPGTPAEDLPVQLLRRRYPALLLERLNFDADSPLKERIRTTTSPEGVIKDNSVLKVLSASIEDGALYAFYDPETGEGDTESMLKLLKNYWSAVAATFPAAWNESPRRSRLVHGAGMLSLGCLMDEIAYSSRSRIPSAAVFQRELERIEPFCAWTDGVWNFPHGEKVRWNELQNLPRDISRLSDFLVGLYRETAKEDMKASQSKVMRRTA